MPELITVALSGGVDSAVASLLLKEQGYDVQGIFMKNWSPETLQGLEDCPWEQDQADAQSVCEHLGIPFRSVNFESEYRERVLQYFLDEYAAGRTPNPDIMCNKEIKFRAFMGYARQLCSERIATGHYAQVENGALKRGVDPLKDQSYFLSALDTQQLRHSIFPLGQLTKKEVRVLAQEAGLPNAKKPDSQGICFIGHLDLKKFLDQNLKQSVGGNVCLLPAHDQGTTVEQRVGSSVEVGTYRGSAYVTIGERAGHLVDNKKVRAALRGADVPNLFVLAKNAIQNTVYVTTDPNDPHFFTDELCLESLTQPISEHTFLVQIRYGQQRLTKAHLESRQGVHYFVAELEGFYAAASGQQAVAYTAEGQVLASGTITKQDGWR